MGTVVIIPHRLIVQIVADKDGKPVLQGHAIEAAKWEIDGVNDPTPLALAPISDATYAEFAELLGLANLDAVRQLGAARDELSIESQLRLEAEQRAETLNAEADVAKAAKAEAIAQRGQSDSELLKCRADLLKEQQSAAALALKVSELEQLLEMATAPSDSSTTDLPAADVA